MKFARLNGEAHTIEAQTIEALPVEHIEAAEPRWPIPPARTEAASLGARLSELLAQESPDDLLGRLGEFKRSVEEALRRSSSAYHILRQLEESGLKDCARCTRELEARLAGNPHYLVLAKIAEAEKLVTELTTVRL
jgi:hypothetical protein